MQLVLSCLHLRLRLSFIRVNPRDGRRARRQPAIKCDTLQRVICCFIIIHVNSLVLRTLSHSYP